MANKKATMTDLRLLIREFIKGTSKRKISEILNLSRTSIDIYLGRMDASGMSAEELLHSDDKTLSQVRDARGQVPDRNSQAPRRR